MRFPKYNSTQPVSVLLVSTFSPKHGAAAGESLGSETLAGHLIGEKGNLVKVDHVDLQLNPNISDLAGQIQREKPHLVGVSVKIGAINQTQKLIEKINQLSLPEAEKPLIVMGGVVPTFAPLRLLKIFPTAIMVKGEGENSITALVETIQGKRPLNQVPGIIYKDKSKILSIPGLRFDLSKRHLPARITTKRIKDELGGIIWAEASRGCNGNCVFCSVREIHNGDFNDSISPKSIVDDLEKLSNMGITLIGFSDDDFSGDPERTLVIANEIINRKLNIQFSVSTRADHIWAERIPKSLANGKSLVEYNLRLRYIIEKLYKAGLIRVFIGLESGSPTQLHRYGKQISVDGNYKALEVLKEVGVDVVAGFIPIDHLMTLQELRENLLFLRKTGMHLKVVNPLSVLRVQSGSPYLKLLQQRGLLGGVSNDLVFYKARFSDKRVQKVAKLADKWVSHMYSLIFGLKGQVQAVSVPQSDGKASKGANRIQQILFSFRELEMEFIETISAILLEDRYASLNTIITRFEEKRQQLIIMTAKEIKNGALSEANYRLKKSIKQLLI